MARLPVPRPTGLEPPRVKAPGPSRTGAGLGAASPTWRASGLTLLRLVSPLLEAVARPRVNGPVAWGLAWPSSFGAWGGWGRGTDRLCAGAGGVSTRERRGDGSLCCPSRDPLGPSFGAPVCGASALARGGPMRILSRRDAIPSESSLSSSPSLPSSSTGDSSSGSPLCLDFDRRISIAWRSRLFFFSFFFFKSIVDFCFSAHSRRLSRSTSSSFTGGLEDRTPIEPCASGDKSYG